MTAGGVATPARSGLSAADPLQYPVKAFVPGMQAVAEGQRRKKHLADAAFGHDAAGDVFQRREPDNSVRR